MKISTLRAQWTIRLETIYSCKMLKWSCCCYGWTYQNLICSTSSFLFCTNFLPIASAEIVKHISISCHLFLQLLYFIFINLLLVCQQLNYCLIEWVAFSASCRTHISVVIQCCCLLGGSFLFFNLLWLFNSVFGGMVFVWCCCVCKKVSNSTICYCSIWSLCTICQYSQLGPSSM